MKYSVVSGNPKNLKKEDIEQGEIIAEKFWLELPNGKNVYLRKIKVNDCILITHFTV